MSRKKSGLIILLLFTIAIGMMYMAAPILAQPGSATDPLVTQRYVDERIATLSAEIALLRTQIIGTPPSTHQPPAGTGGLTQAQRDALFADVMLYFEVMYGDVLNQVLEFFAGMPPAQGQTPVPTPTPPPATSPATPFEALYVQAGRTLIAEAGTEFILRSGQATVIAGPNGIVDITGGQDVPNGEQLSQNHLMHVPQTDGRGLVFNTNAWIMIRGRYTIVN